MTARLEDNKVALRYAKALFDGASEAGEADPVLADLHQVNNLFVTLADLNRFMENPAIPVSEKMSFVEKQFAKVNPWVLRMLKLLVENNRVSILPMMVKHYEEAINRRDNLTQAEVLSATELDSSLMGRIQKTLESTFGYSHVEVTNRVEPGILGGAVIRIQDKVIDGSYIGKLENLRQQVGGKA